MANVADQPINAFLARLGAREPTPGGGAVAALHVAHAAALVAMVARYSDPGETADAVRTAREIATQSDALASRSLALAQADVDAFAAVATAYLLPKQTQNEQRVRRDAITSASLAATRPLVALVEEADAVLQLGARLLEVANRNLITDLGAAAHACRSALAIAELNLTINLKLMVEHQAQAESARTLDQIHRCTQAADALSATILKRL